MCLFPFVSRNQCNSLARAYALRFPERQQREGSNAVRSVQTGRAIIAHDSRTEIRPAAVSVTAFGNVIQVASVRVTPR